MTGRVSEPATKVDDNTERAYRWLSERLTPFDEEIRDLRRLLDEAEARGAAAEREACARMFEAPLAWKCLDHGGEEVETIAQAIRRRGNPPEVCPDCLGDREHAHLDGCPRLRPAEATIPLLTCTHFDEDEWGAPSGAPCGKPATNYSCNNGPRGQVYNACASHKCRCAQPARLDADRTAKPKTEIVGVYPAGATNFYHNAEELIARPTSDRPDKATPHRVILPEGAQPGDHGAVWLPEWTHVWVIVHHEEGALVFTDEDLARSEQGVLQENSGAPGLLVGPFELRRERATEEATTAADALRYSEADVKSLIEYQAVRVKRAIVSWLRREYAQNANAREIATEIERVFLKDQKRAQERRAWGLADHQDAESWYGSFATREEAIEEGRAIYPGQPFWIVEGTYPDPASFLPSTDWLIDNMLDNACTNVGDVAESWPEPSRAAEKALEDTLAAWAREWVPCDFYVADGEKERIEPLPNRRDPMPTDSSGEGSPR